MSKPMLIAVGGMSGSGKTTLASSLAESIPNAVHLDSDRTRKELFGVSETTRLPAEAYSAEATQRLVAEMGRRVKKYLAEGKSVVVSTTFLSPATREAQEHLAAENNAQFVGIWLQADIQVLFNRVAARVNNPSDADVEIVKMQQERASAPAHPWQVIDAARSQEDVVKAALKIIQDAGKITENAPQRRSSAIQPK